MRIQTVVIPKCVLDEARRLLASEEHVTSFTPFLSDPRIVSLRNPRIPAGVYDAMVADHRFGRYTTPSATCPTWPTTFETFLGVLPPQAPTTTYQCVSMTLVWYSRSRRLRRLGYHRDPPAYCHVVSVTLEGNGTLFLKRGNQRGVPIPVPAGTAVALEQEDCYGARHAVDCSDERLALILRYTQ